MLQQKALLRVYLKNHSYYCLKFGNFMKSIPLYSGIYQSETSMIKLQEFRPRIEQLHPHVKGYSIMESDGTFISDTWEKCIPDGYIKLFLCGQNAPMYKDVDGKPLSWKDGIGGHPTDPIFFIKLPKGKSLFVWISMKPYFFNWISKVPISDLNNNITALDNFFGKEDLDLVYTVFEQPNYDRMVQVLDAFLWKQYQKATQINDSSLQIHSLIYSSQGVVHFEQLTKAQNISMRTLQRNFNVQMGMSPKHFARIVRFSQVMRLFRERPDYTWLDISYLCGYHDQSHFIHDVRSITGLTPSDFFGDQHRIIANLHLGRS